MSWGWLGFLADPWFVVPWYLVGGAAGATALWDMKTRNRQVDKAVMWAWPIIITFFSVIGAFLYLVTVETSRNREGR